MRILITIAHYFNAERGTGDYNRRHGSLKKNPLSRIQALSVCINSLQRLFAGKHCMIDHSRVCTQPADQVTDSELDIFVCTTGGHHVLADLQAPSDYYRHQPTKVNPLLLGFECQALLRDHLGKYDYYCFMEDDLILQDSWFFLKLAWFNRHVGNANLLQPNRYEVGPHSIFRKAYIDGNLPADFTAPFQDVSKTPELASTVLGVPIVFKRTLNPHAGCYFLNAAQMEHWTKQSYFLDRDISFMGPLESAATLGIMRTFAVYKTAPEFASFLEIHHATMTLLTMIRPIKPTTSDPPAAG